MGRYFLCFLSVFFGMASLPVFGALDFFVPEDGSLNVIRNGKPVIIGEELFVLNADWDKVARPLQTRLVRNHERGGKVVCSWAADVSVIERSAERLPNGSIKVVWKMKFLNGIVKGDHIELTYLMPNRVFDYPEGGAVELFTSNREMLLDAGDGLLRFEFSGTQQPWKFQDMRRLPLYGNFRLLFSYPYDPARINVVESTFIISEKEKEEK